MPGRPGLAALNAHIQSLPDGEDWVYDRLSEGMSISQVARELGCSHRQLYMWRDMAAHNPERTDRWTEAIRLSGEAHAESGEQLLEDLSGKPVGELTPAVVSLTGKRADYKKWMARVRDPSFADAPQIGVTLNIQALHLEALQQRGRAPVQQIPVEIHPLLPEPAEDEP